MIARWVWVTLSDNTGVSALIRTLNLRFARLTAQLDTLQQLAIGVIPVPNGTTTPSVVGARIVLLSNSAPTNVVSLLGRIEGQTVVLWATTGFTTLVHSAALSLKGGANVTMTATETREFATLDGVTWREL